MSLESFELDHDAFSRLLYQRKISHAEIARRLGVSTKTIQRWVNRTSKTIRAELLQEVSQIFGVETTTLVKSPTSTKVRPTNRALEELISSKYLQRTYATGEWSSYLKILKNFDPDELSSLQETTLRKNLGVTYLYLGMPRSGKFNLARASLLSQKLNSLEHQNEISIWLSAQEESEGNLLEAIQYLSLLEEQTAESPFATQGWVALRRGNLHLHFNEVDKAISCLRKAISIFYKDRKDNLTNIAISYALLGQAYITKEDLRRALSTYSKLVGAASAAGWNSGKAQGYMGLSLVHYLLKSENKLPLMGRAHKYRRVSTPTLAEHMFLHLDFIHSILADNLEEAEHIAQKRLRASRTGRLYGAYAILDLLYLSKLKPDLMVSAQMIESAQFVFQKNNMVHFLDKLNHLKSKASLTKTEFLRSYLY